jgi:hypothetical protein
VEIGGGTLLLAGLAVRAAKNSELMLFDMA